MTILTTFFIAIGTLVGLYLFIGLLAAIYETIQTDDSFDWTTILSWLYKVIK